MFMSSLRKMVQTKPLVVIDVISDIACPWCFVGKKKLEQALQMMETKAAFQVNYHPYQLDPNTPVEGIPRNEFLKKKFGSPTPRMNQFMDYLNDTGMQCGIDFCFKDEAKSASKMVSNTFDAHRLVYFAQTHHSDLTDKVLTLLFQAYQEKGLNVAKREVLLDVAAEAGLPLDRVNKYLDSDEGAQEVRKMDTEAKRSNITGVPHFTIRGPIPELTEPLLKSWSIRQLKTKLFRRGVDDTECIEKSDLIKKVLATNSLEKPPVETLSGAQDPVAFSEAIENVLRT